MNDHSPPVTGYDAFAAYLAASAVGSDRHPPDQPRIIWWASDNLPRQQRRGGGKASESGAQGSGSAQLLATSLLAWLWAHGDRHD